MNEWIYFRLLWKLPRRIVYKSQLTFCRGNATLHLAVSVRPSVGPVTFINCKLFFLHYRPCPTVRDCPAVYPALLPTESSTDTQRDRQSDRPRDRNLNKNTDTDTHKHTSCRSFRFLPLCVSTLSWHFDDFRHCWLLCCCCSRCCCHWCCCCSSDARNSRYELGFSCDSSLFRDDVAPAGSVDGYWCAIVKHDIVCYIMC